MNEIVLAHYLLWLCVLGAVVASVGWWLTNLQARRWEQERQEVRERLADIEVVPAAYSIVACEKHLTVSPDYCATCRVEELVEPRLRPGGIVVHSK